MTDKVFTNQMMANLATVGIHDEHGTNPGSMRVYTDLFYQDPANMIMIHLWYSKNHALDEMKQFFEEKGSGWLWYKYKNENNCDYDQLVESMIHELSD